MNRKLLLSALAATMMTAAAMTPAVTYADKLSDAQKQVHSLQSQADETKQKITDLKHKENSLRQQITDIQSQISDLQNSIFVTQSDIARRNAEIDNLQQKIQETERDIDAQYKILAQRVRVMYEAGNSTYFDVLFSATSFSDLLDRLQFLSIIAEQDKQVLTNIRDNKVTLDSQQTQMKVQLGKIQDSLRTLNSKKAQQESAQQTESRLLSQVHDERLSQESELKSENSSMQNLKSMIQQLQAAEGSYSGPATGWAWPVPGYHTISSPYGWRTWPGGGREFHNGIDIPAPVGTPMVATTSGRVLYAGPASGFGDWIVIESAGGLIEIYGHMYDWEIKVHPGQIVQTGQQIAGVGSNGFSTGAHLHLTIARGFDSNGFPISLNPTQYVR